MALHTYMGLVKKPRQEDYWSQGSIADTPGFGEWMSRNVFQLILTNLTLNDKAKEPPKDSPHYDRLYWLRPILDMCSAKFKNNYYPERDLTIDEAGIPWRGRGGKRQFNPNKPHKYHIKIYEVCESDSGYVLSFELYGGTDAPTEDVPTEDPDCQKTTQLVLRLLRAAGVVEVGHHLYADNYYTSPQLAKELLAVRTHICGTTRKDRQGFSQAVNYIALYPEECIFRRNIENGILALKWVQKRKGNPKAVIMLSTIHAAKEQDVQEHFTHTYVVTKPTCVLDYNKKMNGVDKNDQLCQYYHNNRRTEWWSVKVFFHFFTIIITNAYILYKKYHIGSSKEGTTHLEFQKEVLRAMMEEGKQTRSHKPRRQYPNEEKVKERYERLNGRHFSSRTDGKKQRKCFVCRQAKRKGYTTKVHSSSHECKKCQLVLCFIPCFEAYHSKVDYLNALAKGGFYAGQNENYLDGCLAGASGAGIEEDCTEGDSTPSADSPTTGSEYSFDFGCSNDNTYSDGFTTDEQGGSDVLCYEEDGDDTYCENEYGADAEYESGQFEDVC